MCLIVTQYCPHRVVKATRVPLGMMALQVVQDLQDQQDHLAQTVDREELEAQEMSYVCPIHLTKKHVPLLTLYHYLFYLPSLLPSLPCTYQGHTRTAGTLLTVLPWFPSYCSSHPTQGPPGVCSACTSLGTGIKGVFYGSEPRADDHPLGVYGSVERPAASCHDLSLELSSMKTSGCLLA